LWGGGTDTDETCTGIAAYTAFLQTEAGRLHVPHFEHNLAKAQEYIHHTHDADDNDKEPPQDTEEEDWMLLCRLNHHFTMDTDPPNDGVDWVEHARALPPDILRDCCTWVSSRRKESQDNPSSPWHCQLPPVDITTLNLKQCLAYNIISHHHNKNHSQPSTSSTTHACLWHGWHW